MISSYILLYQGGSSEYFNPETGEGYGVKSFGWNGIVRKMFSWHDSVSGNFVDAIDAAGGFKVGTLNSKNFIIKKGTTSVDFYCDVFDEIVTKKEIPWYSLKAG